MHTTAYLKIVNFARTYVDPSRDGRPGGKVLDVGSKAFLGQLSTCRDTFESRGLSYVGLDRSGGKVEEGHNVDLVGPPERLRLGRDRRRAIRLLRLEFNL